MKKIFLLGLMLMLLTGCNNAVAKHSEAIEELVSSGQLVKAKDSQETNEGSTLTLPDTGGEYSQTDILEMKRQLIEQGAAENYINNLPDSVVINRFKEANLTLDDADLWQVAAKQIDLKDVQEQIKEQYEEIKKADKEATTYNYALNVQVPDIKKIELADLDIKLPELDYEQLYAKDNYLINYQVELEQAIKAALKEHLTEGKKLKTSQAQIKVAVTEKEKEATATLAERTLAPIAAQVQADQRDFVSRGEELPEKQKVDLIQKLNTKLRRDLPLALVPRITAVEVGQGENEYQVSLASVNNLPAILKDLQTKENEGYQKSYPKGTFYTIQNTTIRTNLTNKLTKSQLSYGEPQKVSVHHTSLNTSIDSTQQKALVDAHKQQLDQAVKEIKSFVDKNIVKTVQSRPKTSVLSGSNSGSSIKVEIPTKQGDYFVKFVNSSNTSKVVLSGYIRQGESLTIHLAPGTYRMRFARGEGSKWYGTDSTFGPQGYYAEGANTITVASGYSYTLKLYGVSAGNLPINSLSNGSF